MRAQATHIRQLACIAGVQLFNGLVSFHEQLSVLLHGPPMRKHNRGHKKGRHRGSVGACRERQ